MRNFAHTGKRNPPVIVTKFCLWVGIQDLITSATFGDDRTVKGLRGLDVARGSNFPFPHRFASPPLQHSGTTVRVCGTASCIASCRHFNYLRQYGRRCFHLYLFLFLSEWPTLAEVCALWVLLCTYHSHGTVCYTNVSCLTYTVHVFRAQPIIMSPPSWPVH